MWLVEVVLSVIWGRRPLFNQYYGVTELSNLHPPTTGLVSWNVFSYNKDRAYRLTLDGDQIQVWKFEGVSYPPLDLKSVQSLGFQKSHTTMTITFTHENGDQTPVGAYLSDGAEALYEAVRQVFDGLGDRYRRRLRRFDERTKSTRYRRKSDIEPLLKDISDFLQESFLLEPKVVLTQRDQQILARVKKLCDYQSVQKFFDTSNSSSQSNW